MTERSRASRFAVNINPDRFQFRNMKEAMWYESPEEIEAGLEWGEEKAKLLRWVQRQMGRRLTKRERRCIELYYFEGMTFREVADRTGTNASSAHRAIRRAVRKLHALAEKGDRSLAKVMKEAPHFQKPDKAPARCAKKAK